jgi:hypothetical protein
VDEVARNRDSGCRRLATSCINARPDPGFSAHSERRRAAAFLVLNDETAQGPFRTRGMGRWVAMNIGGRHGRSLPRSRENEGRPKAPLEVGFGSRYGVGSGYEPPKMSVLPNVAGQSCCGAGRFGSVASPAAVPFTTVCR